MPTFFDSVYKASARMAETGLSMMDAVMRAAQSTVTRMSGQDGAAPSTVPPVGGPVTMDDRVSDFTNRLARIAWSTPIRAESLSTMGRDIWAAARKSFESIPLQDPLQWLALPLQLPLSLGTLMTQQSLRALYSSYIVGPQNFPAFASYVAETFTDTHVIVSLQYKELLARYRAHMDRFPDDSRTRIKLGQLYLKMGLYPEASREFHEAARDVDLRSAALFESTVANFRAGDFHRALEDAAASIVADPGNNRARYWLWLAAQELGGYPQNFPDGLRVQVKSGWHEPKVVFEEAAAQMGLDKTSGGRGTAVFDFDGDGYLDLVIASAHGGCSLYRNNRDGTFADVTVGSGLDEAVNTFAVIVGDYNNDGWDDLFITRLGFYAGESVLYRNNGDGTFTDVTRESGVASWGPAFAAQWVDYDCDGNLDLFVANNLGELFDRKTPNRLFHNNGDGTFTEVAEKAGLLSSLPTIGAAWGDYNNDGYPDVFVSNGVGRSQLFRNNRDGTFTDVSRESGIDEIAFGSVAFWLDYDDDGWLDLVQCIWSPEEDGGHSLLHGQAPRDGHPMCIYHNNRDGTFTKKDRELGIDGCWGTMSGNAGDCDNDGHPDILLGNGDPHMERTEPPTLLEFDGNGLFRNVTFAAGLPFSGKGHGVNMADLAGDGRMCLIVASGGSYPGDLITTSVFRPKTLPGNYLNVRLVGTRSNRNAIGARLKLNAGGRSQHRLVSCGSGFGCLPYEQHFGLARIEKVELLEIEWPSGLKQRVDNLPINNTIRITEAAEGWTPVYP